MSYFGPKDYLLEVAKGNVAGHSGVNKFGRNANSASDTEEDVWTNGGTYSFPATADITHIRQASDVVADRGATIEVQGLDTNWDLTVQDVVLNASDSSTPVALTTALRRVFRMKTKHTATFGADIQLRNVGGGTTYAVITAAFNQTQMAIYTVADGYTGYVYRASISGGKDVGLAPSSVIGRIYTRDNANGYAKRLRQEIGTLGDKATHEFCPPMVVSAREDIWMASYCHDAGGIVHGTFDLVLVAD